MKKLQVNAALFFIFCVVVLAAISILGVWQVFNSDVISKSTQTVGLLALVAGIIIIAGKFVDSRESASPTGVVENNPLPVFANIRHATAMVLTASIVFLALLGVLAIWEVFEGEVLFKSLSSISIIVFSSLAIVVACLIMEKHKIMQNKISGWTIFISLMVIWMLMGFVGMLFTL